MQKVVIGRQVIRQYQDHSVTVCQAIGRGIQSWTESHDKVRSEHWQCVGRSRRLKRRQTN